MATHLHCRPQRISEPPAQAAPPTFRVLLFRHINQKQCARTALGNAVRLICRNHEELSRADLQPYSIDIKRQQSVGDETASSWSWLSIGDPTAVILITLIFAGPTLPMIFDFQPASPPARSPTNTPPILINFNFSFIPC